MPPREFNPASLERPWPYGERARSFPDSGPVLTESAAVVLTEASATVKRFEGRTWPTLSDKEKGILRNALFKVQGGRCAICKQEMHPREAHLDHCHVTDVVRGVLCRWCNFGLGNFKDSIERIKSAVNYLIEHVEKTYH
jgi:hypothetical protein